MPLNAHTPRRSDGGWHLLRDHSEGVAVRAESRGAGFGGALICKMLGLAHDAGKASAGFQRYLLACHNGTTPERRPHSAPGAAAVHKELGPFSLAVMGHHAAIPNSSDGKSVLENADKDDTEAAKRWLATLPEFSDVSATMPDWVRKDKLALEFLIRMCFSCLVDADYLDTEQHFSPERDEYRGAYRAISEYRATLEAHLAELCGKATDSSVNAVRREILESARKTAQAPRGAFRLTVPTGGGKTLSGLAFALDHACVHGIERVIVAIPYTSIIDQTAAVYTKIFGEGSVLEHHSAIEVDSRGEGQDEVELRRRLNAENWDCPLVVTTTVQLFESLLHNKPSRCRKLHNIANSVIVLDEVQALPPKHLGPILDVLAELVTHYGCSVVFSTATQLGYSTVDDRLLRDASEIVPDYRKYFELLKRVSFTVEQDRWTAERLADRIQSEPRSLVVLNTRKDALAVVRACLAAGVPDGELLHLSTLMCPHHRKEVLSEVRSRLAAKRPVRLISTQVVEAGVDVDFPIVFRDLGPLDRIIQVAGRCNREGKLQGVGRCVVFHLEGGGAPRGPYKSAIEITRTLLEEFGEELDAPEALRRFSRSLFGLTETGSLQAANNRAEIQKLRKELAFASVAAAFKMIEEDTKPVIVESYADASDLIAEWDRQPSGWFRRVAPYAVNVFDRDLKQLQRDGLVREHPSGAWIYSGDYDRKFGLVPGFSDPADLIV